jgi:methyl-accepting chemotaxis protein
MENPAQPHKRSWKNLLIKKELQLKVGLLIALALLTLVVVFLFQTFMGLNDILQYGINVDRASRMRLFQMVFGLVYAVFIFLFSIYLSHKIAGPLYRLENDVKTLAQDGDLTRMFRLRKRDEMQGMAEALNTLVTRFREKLVESTRIREHELENLRKVAQELAEGSKEKEEKLRQLEEIAERLRKVDEIYFKIQ